MVRDFDNYFKEFLDNLMSDELLRSDNYAYLELEEGEKECYDAAEEVLNSLSAEKKATLEAFLEASIKVHGQRAEFLYQQGMKDVVRFLKFFEVL